MNPNLQEADAEALGFLQEHSARFLEQPDLRCAVHPDANAFTCCPSCGQPLCKACALSSLEELCDKCLKERRRKSLFGKIWQALCQPALWVAFCIAIAAVLYSLGLGNQGIEEKQQEDINKGWSEKTAPRLYLAKASRERKRAAVLKAEGRTQEAVKWNLQASKSFQKTVSLWGELTPAAFAPALAAAETLALAGEPEEALKMALAVKEPAESEQDVMDYHFAMAKIADAAKNCKVARDHYEKALAKTQVCSEKNFDSLLTQLASNSKEANFAAKVRVACGLSAKPSEVAARAKESLGIIERPDGQVIRLIRVDSPKSEEIKIERLDQPDIGSR